MRNEYEEWQALDARVTAWESGEGPPLTQEEEARWGAILEGWPLALEQVRTMGLLLSGLPEEERGRALRLCVDALERLVVELGHPVPLWMGLAREAA